MTAATVLAAACGGNGAGASKLDGGGAVGGNGRPAGEAGAPGSGSGGQAGLNGGAGTGGGTLGIGGGLGGGNGGVPAGGGGMGGAVSSACSPLPAIIRRVWRLSPRQYVNATRDLLVLSTTPDINARTDEPMGTALFSPPSLQVGAAFLFDGLYVTASTVLGQIDTTRLQQLAACVPGATDTACATAFAQAFGRRVFRRPLGPDEVADLVKVFQAGAVTSFTTGIKLMIKALLLAPSFLYRTELGPAPLVADAAGNFPAITLTPYEVATQLGFMFLDSTPDAALLEAADSGILATPAGVMAQVDRLLATNGARETVVGLVSRWFALGDLPDKVNKSPDLLTTLSVWERDQTVIVGELATSVHDFLNTTLWGAATSKVADLLTSRSVVVNDHLARLYGLTLIPSTNANGFVSMTWPAAQPRAGILTQPAFLWNVSAPDNTGIIQRGMMIHDRFLCQDPLPPPTSLTTAEAMAILAMGDSEISRSDARLSGGSMSCAASCHAQIDPYGRVLQGFDAIGNYRTVDEAIRPVVASGTFTPDSPLAPMTIVGPDALAQALLSTKTFTACAVQTVSSYASGAPISRSNTCEIKDLARQFDLSDGNVSTLMRQVALAPFVRARSGGTQ